MELTLIIAFVLALLVGLSLGLLGGGGSILTVPILSYVVGLPPREAIASSLFIVGATSAVGALRHARAGRVRWKTGLLFGVAGMVGALLGGVVGDFVPGGILMVLFAIMMVATASAMIRGRKTAADRVQTEDRRSVPRVLGIGVLVGFATGLIGAGGGFLIVPALTLFAGLPMVVAVGTSLLVIVMNSLAGFAGNALTVPLDWPFVLAFTAIAVAGSLVGAKLAGRIPERALRRGFGFFVLAMGALVLIQEVPPLIPI
ncbi:sulfite exporter TauE/SafE family protein [Leucobacter ruminantium]|uniref:Probable membrane transporter protein n=1 Tax=Leucobacter ruminantium TaxID=1289170 RepID=A0A939LUB6_9MICO|nr:sulfite exporter TauE/SafE family protein [Leucobacter ruminantium]MBO1804521.1 sulfite exporter TauE/SafE family protein [Leucobacter ruminantium]